MKSVCVFCGSSVGRDERMASLARSLGERIARLGLRLVYGGARVGLMGVVADAALTAGGRVAGVIPQRLIDLGVAHRGLTELHPVDGMHERKALMAELADGFIALPGGIGTLEEFFEVWTWGQLGLHAKPYGILEIDGFFGPLLVFLDQLVEQGFLRPAHREMLLIDEDPASLLERMRQTSPVYVPKLPDAEAGVGFGGA